MREKDRIEWYMIGLGNEVDMHTVHFHAQSFIYRVHTQTHTNIYGGMRTVRGVDTNASVNAYL